MRSPASSHITIPLSLLPLLQELGELKRVRAAARDGSMATRLFLASWSRLLDGVPAREAMRCDLAAALAAARLGELDRASLEVSGLPPDEVGDVLGRGFDAVSGSLDPALAEWLRAGLDAAPPTAEPPRFARHLADQPRAGATRPGRARLVLEPPENHAEHCELVAVLSVLLSPVYGADPTIAWLASLAHHLHNALMPDSGYAGEMLLGEHLLPLTRSATERALGELPAPLASAVREARHVLDDADTPEGRAFHAADTLDRVWQIEQHLRPGQVTMELVLGDMALVHDGPVKRFQDEVLVTAGFGP